MSLLATETQNKVAACRMALQAIERHLEPLLAKNPVDVARKLAPLEQAELQGVDPADHPIKQELDRIQLYFKKLRTTKDEIETKEAARERHRVDTEAAQRMMQQYASAAEASMQRRQALAATEPSAASSTSVVEQKETVVKPPESAQASQKVSPAHAPEEATPKASIAADEEAASTPARKKRRLQPKSGASSSQGIGEQGSPPAPSEPQREPQAQLVPLEPATEEAHVTAASLVAKGKADAARAALKKKRKAESRVANAGAAAPAAASDAGTSAPAGALAEDEPSLA